MKKIVIAAALAVASLSAAAQATVYGRMNATVDNTKTGDTTVNRIVNDISHIGFRVNEDLGSGLSARAVIETSIANQDPTGNADTKLGDRQSTVGLASKEGSIDLGRNVHSIFTTISAGDSFSMLYGNIAGDIHNVRGVRISNGVFARVNPLQNVTLGVDRTHTAVGAESTIYSASARFNRVNIGVAHYEQDVEKSTVVSANTKVGNTGLFYSHSNNQGATDSKGHLVGLTQKVGAYTLKTSYGRQSKDPVFVIGPSASGPQEKTTAYAVGVDYEFSKRTQVGVAYRNVDKHSASSDIKQIGVGITHRF